MSVQTKEELVKIQQAIRAIAESVKKSEVKTRQLDAEIKEMERASEGDLAQNVKEAEEALKEKEKVESKATRGVKYLKDNIEQDDRERKQGKKSLTDDRKTLTASEKDSSGLQATFDRLLWMKGLRHRQGLPRHQEN